MPDLFTDDRIDAPPAIPGLRYLREYISPREERELVAAIDAEAWDESWDRRRQPYGASYGKKNRAERPIPMWGLKLAKRLQADGIGDRPFDQMLVNEYAPGQGI